MSTEPAADPGGLSVPRGGVVAEKELGAVRTTG